MLKRIKEALLYPVSDPTWLKKSTNWWCLGVLYLTIPLLVVHFFEVVRKAACRPEDEPLPEFEQTLKGLLRGLLWCLAILGLPYTVLLSIWLLSISLNLSEAGLDQVSIMMTCVCLAWAITLPAAAINFSVHSDYLTTFRPRKLLETAMLNPKQYLFLLFLPPALLAVLLCLGYFVPVFLIWLVPALPLFTFSYARLLGFYYRDNAAL